MSCQMIPLQFLYKDRTNFVLFNTLLEKTVHFIDISQKGSGGVILCLYQGSCPPPPFKHCNIIPVAVVLLVSIGGHDGPTR